MRNHSIGIWLAIVLAVAAPEPAAIAQAERAGLPILQTAECQVPDTVAWSRPLLSDSPASQVALPELIVVALGSSSTVGVGASSAQNGFVAQFVRAFETRTGGRRIHVINAGVNGDTAANMRKRLHTDVLDRKPAVVIWQTGTNDALQQVPVLQFRQDLTDGIAELKSRSINIVLVDQQNFTRASAVKDFASYVRAVEDVAQQENVTLLHRYRVMRYLSERRSGGIQSLLASDRLHMNDVAHRCIGELLADGIGRLLR